MKILVTGATGYVGGRLVPHLLVKGYSLRVMGRSLQKLRSRSWADHPQVELVQGDVLDQESLSAACADCDVAYYLVHSMLPGQKDYAEADREAAHNMVHAADACHLKRIIYLGGLGIRSQELSSHLKSRHEVGQILKSGKTPTTELRAAMIIGSGSASFEILRYLVERLPIMITPRWLQTPLQPIAIRNVIIYLAECLSCEATAGDSFDIGGPDVLTYKQLMRLYSEEAHLRRRIIIPVPVLTPRLSSYWIHLVTPVSASIARPLANGLKNPVLCQDDRITKLIPQKLLTPREAIGKALVILHDNTLKSHWTDAGKLPPYESVYEGDPAWAGGTLFRDMRSIKVHASPGEIWKVIERIGGSTGWYHANWLWQFRGWLDKLFGGVGLRRGRRDAGKLHVGDALDFWRVIQVQEGSKLVLSAEMKMPGRAILEFSISQDSHGDCKLHQNAYFKPKGLLGMLYWYAVLPFHHYIFAGMQKRIRLQAEQF